MNGLPTVVPRDLGLMLVEGVYIMPKPANGSEAAYLLYAPAADKIFPLTDGQAALLLANAGSERSISSLVESFLGVPISPAPVTPDLELYKPNSVALMMTTACQLRCTYCYAEAGSTPTQNLSVRVATEAIKFICQNAIDLGKKSITVHFHGAGEPTLLWRQIFDCLEFAKVKAAEGGLDLTSILTTNLCIEPELAVRFAREIDIILVSCDGTPDVMDKNRPMLRGSSGAAIDLALRAVVADGNAKKLLIRATITRETQGRLPDFIGYFADVGLHNIYLVPVSDSGRGINHESVEPEVFIRSWRAASELASKQGMRLESPVTDLDRLKPAGFACGINGSNFAVMPDGRISLCYEAVIPDREQDALFKIGNVDTLRNKFVVDLKRVNDVRKAFHVSQRKSCDSCFAKLSCGGRCAAREIGPITAPRDAPMTIGCDITRTLTFDGILRRLHEAERRAK